MFAQQLSEKFAAMALLNQHTQQHGQDCFADSDGRIIFKAQILAYPEIETAVIKNYDVGRAYEGCGVGRAALQAIMRKAEQEGLKAIELFKVQGDGLTFWPKFGAIPHDLSGLGQILEGMQEVGGISRTQKAQLRKACAIASISLEKAWFGLTDMRSSWFVSRDVMAEVSFRQANKTTMVLALDNPIVRGRLALDCC